MTDNQRWRLLDLVTSNLSSQEDFPSGFMSAVAERMDEALTAPLRGTLGTLAGQLEQLFDALLQVAPTEVVEMVQGASTSADQLTTAYKLGQVSFAQLLAAHGFEKRISEDFIAWVNDHRFKNYVMALREKQLTCQELAHLGDERAETVSRKLKQMRELGIADFRKEGTRIYNFLTPAANLIAREFAPNNSEARESESKPGLQMLVSLRLQQNTPQYMQKGSSFSFQPPTARYK